MADPRRRPLSLGLLAFALAGAVNLSGAAPRSRPYDVTNVPKGAVARVLALGHRTLVSDLYWLVTVQYVGDIDGDARGWDHLLPLLELVTDLDPRHGYAYQTGGIVLSAVGRIEESNRILSKGLERAPRWTFPYYLSFNHWFYLGDYEAAARYARMAAAMPGASPNVSQLAVALSSKNGTPEDALAMLDLLAREVPDGAVAARLAEQRKLALLERDAQRLERAAQRFEAEHARPPGGLDELKVSGYITEVPPDPFGGRYEWHADERRVRSSANPFRFSARDAEHAPGFHYQPSRRLQEEMTR